MGCWEQDTRGVVEVIKEIPKDVGEYFTVRPSGCLIRNFTEKVTGCVDSMGYVVVRHKGSVYKAHRIVFYITYGWCPDLIDHIDGNKQNNRPSNLRAATSYLNSAHQKTPSNSTTKCKGVGWHVRNNKWVARLSINGVRHNLGNFKDFFEAVCVVKSAENRMYKEMGWVV